MSKLVKEILFLKKGEQRALLIISLLLFTSLIFRTSILFNSAKEDQPDSDFIVQIEKLREEMEKLELKKTLEIGTVVKSTPALNPMYFNPNTVNRDTLIQMGFPPSATENLIRYREAGGRFRKPGDLRKIYGMDSLVYQAISGFILIEDASSKDSNVSGRQTKQAAWENKKGGASADHVVRSTAEHRAESYAAPSILMELNAADSMDLIKIRGIGPVYSSRIIRYRDLLGGFYSLDQLWDIYGMDSLKYEFLSASLYIDTSLVRCEDINKVSYHSLIRHPYFSRKQVEDLLHYRNFAGEIRELAELKTNQVLDSAGYEKIKHYLKCRINKF